MTSSYVSMALQGDLSAAGKLFSETNLESQPPSVAELASGYESRFVHRNESLSPETGDELVDAIVSAYRDYWVSELVQPTGNKSGDLKLEKSLGELLGGQPTGPYARQEDLFATVGAVLENRGFHYLEGPASPLRDLFLWKQEENRNYNVRLTDGTQAVRVTFMSEIYSLGWKEFATLGLVSTTGWVEDDRLYCVSWAYDRNSENFEISYLKHEARHLADLERFPALSSADLEYRAKLTELSFAFNSLRRLLDDFTRKSAPNPASPHAYANYRVIRDLYRSIYSRPLPNTGDPWVNVNAESVARTARKLLERNTAQLEQD
ncbi:MAG: hypothetical protein HKN57_00875 [Xanthomonadales bacterium]|nr:hypothetical protein [Gammaproteobacteria bacterium]NND55781.1 hypothetical protein [Xanthomonadales bacterium]